MDIKEKIHSLSEDLLKNIERLVVINSQLGTPAEGMPFGPGPAKALDEALSIARELGFKTVNLDHYCGYAEMGEGDDIVGIAGHLDIVPAGGDWTYDPFALTRKGDYVYGRGTTDDKGPVLEALYAMKLLREDDYIAMDRYGTVTLLEKGEQIAVHIYERHTVLSKMLEHLGVDPEIAREDACKLEHDLSDESFAKIKEHFHKNVGKVE